MTTTRLHYAPVENADPHCTKCGGNGILWNGNTCDCCHRELPVRCPSCESLAVDARNGQAKCLDCGHTWGYGANKEADRDTAERNIELLLKEQTSWMDDKQAALDALPKYELGSVDFNPEDDFI